MSTVDFGGHRELKRNPLFWQHLHLQNPAKFVFGDEIALILDNSAARRLLDAVSKEIHKKFIFDRNVAFRRFSVKPKAVPPSSIHERFHRILAATSDHSDSQILFHRDATQRIIERIAGGEDPCAPLDLRIKFSERIRRLFRKHAVRIGSFAVESLAKRFVAFLAEMTVQIWHLERTVFVEDYVPTAEEFYRDPVGRAACFYEPHDMLERLPRSQYSASIIQQILHSESPFSSLDLIFDTEFVNMFPSSFKYKFGLFLSDFKRRITEFHAEKCEILSELPLNEPLSIDQIVAIIRFLVQNLVNEEKMTIFGEKWAEYVCYTVGQLKSIDKNDATPGELEMSLKRDEFTNVLITGNRTLCRELAPIYKTEHIEEQRGVLAQLLRFLLKFAADLIRHCFHVKMDAQNGKIAEIRYNGHFEQLGDPGPVHLYSDQKDVLGEVFRRSDDKESSASAEEAFGLATFAHTSNENAFDERIFDENPLMKPMYHCGWYQTSTGWRYAKKSLMPSDCPMNLHHSLTTLTHQQESVPSKNAQLTFNPIFHSAPSTSLSLTSSEASTSSLPTSTRAESLVVSLNLLRESRSNNRNELAQRPLRRRTPAPIRLPTPSVEIGANSDEENKRFARDNNSNERPIHGRQEANLENEEPKIANWVLCNYPEIVLEKDPNVDSTN